MSTTRFNIHKLHIMPTRCRDEDGCWDNIIGMASLLWLTVRGASPRGTRDFLFMCVILLRCTHKEAHDRSLTATLCLD
jgi:hypothetical protein